jgi:hypothetical protein
MPPLPGLWCSSWTTCTGRTGHPCCSWGFWPWSLGLHLFSSLAPTGTWNCPGTTPVPDPWRTHQSASFPAHPTGGLSQEDVGALIKLVGGVTPPLALVQEVYQQTEGNPLFITEVARLLAQEGRLAQISAGESASLPQSRGLVELGWSLGIPQGVREAIGRRLSRLSEDCNRVLIVASITGREFGLDQLERIIPDLSQDRPKTRSKNCRVQ